MMAKVQVHDCGDWKYLIEITEDSVQVRPYNKGEPLTVEIGRGKNLKRIAFCHTFFGSNNDSLIPDKVKDYCDRFSKEEKFRARRLRLFKRALKENL